jgi:chromosome segregation ATPase
MKQLVFPILAVVATAAALYFTITQTDKFQAIQDLRIATEEEIIVVNANIEDHKAKIAVEEDNKKVAQDERTVAQNSVANYKTENSSIENEVATLDAKIAVQDTQIGELKQVVAGVKQEFGQVGIEVSLATIDANFKTVNVSIETKQGTDRELDESIAKEEKRLADKRAEIDRYNSRIQARDLRIAQNEIEARVTAVNHDWGFIMIGAGSNSGFMPDTKLLIKRDGRLIGTVKPSSIEPTQTVADIEFSSLAPGVRFQPGDEVILAKPANN